MRPETVVLDEPVDGLDPVMRRQVWNVLLSDVAENGTTVLISSHNLRELEDVCDHVGIMNKGKMMIERNLADLQESLVKVQLALPEGKSVPDGLDILHMSELGHLKTIIVRGSTDDVTGKLAAASPMFIDVLPLTLEEIFVYELGGAGYEVKDISI
jgi:ABC-2 type transport system ATP-binding protein